MQDKDGLIGYTGLVGSNLMLQRSFNKTYNSRNISEIEGEKFDQLVCAGVSGTKFLANGYPEQDKNNILKLIENIKKIREVKKFILISTVDVYPNVSAGDETTDIENIGLNHYYGTHRADVEKFIKEYFDDYLIVRLPAIYGENLKKNFIFDMIYKIPYLIKKEVFIDLQKKLQRFKRKK